MGEHDFCRMMLRSTLDDMKKGHTRRFLKAEVTGDTQFGNSHHFWVKVIDSVRPTGFCIGGEGHFRSMDYEVEACCRYEAKHKALEMLARDFDRMKEESQTIGANIVEKKPEVKCQALVERLRTLTGIRGTPREVDPHQKPACQRNAAEQVGHLHLCRQHARLARQGFVEHDGSVVSVNTRNDYARYPKKFTSPACNWWPDANPRNT